MFNRVIKNLTKPVPGLSMKPGSGLLSFSPRMQFSSKIKPYQLEKIFGVSEAPSKRREYYETKHGTKINLKDNGFNYPMIHGVNCENVIGTIRIPVGLCGPLKVNGIDRFVPIATTEGALVSSINRGCKGLNLSGGVDTIVTKRSMTRSPLLKCDNIHTLKLTVKWIDDNRDLIEQAFNSTTRFGKLLDVRTFYVGNQIHIRLEADSGDAMGMNMLTKGSEEVVKLIVSCNPGVRVVTLSGNTCTDKKYGAMNWILGRGISGIAEVKIPETLLNDIFRVSGDQLVELNKDKNLLGSIRAGLTGGSNSQTANIVAGIYLATGQDCAHVGTSSKSIINIEKYDKAGDHGIVITNTMPCLEIGTIGGGTGLEDQNACLDIMGIKRLSGSENVGKSTDDLAGIIMSTIISGELSLLSAMINQELVESHMRLNRKQ